MHGNGGHVRRNRPAIGISLLLAGLFLALGGLWQPAGTASQATEFPPILYDAVRDDQRAAIVEETAGELSLYEIEATLGRGAESQPGIITGVVDLAYVNGTGGPLTDLYVRLYANDPRYGDGEIELLEVAVAGEATVPEPVAGSDETAVRLPLPAPLAAGEMVAVTMGFESTVPVQPRSSYGMYSIQPSTGTWALAHWFPLVAGYTALDGWNIGPLTEIGDPIFSNTALFDVTLTAPSDLVVVTTGTAVSETVTGDLTRRRYVSGPVRDFTMVADDNFASVSDEVDGVVVTSYFNPEDREAGERVLQYGLQSLAIFNDLFGPYPYVEMDLVEVALQGGVAGIEFPQLMMIGADYYDDGPTTGPLADFLEFTVAHEVAHQWWYGMIGNDHYADAFIDEGLTNYVTTVYFERQYGADEGDEQRDLNLLLSYLMMLFRSGDEVADKPTDDFRSQGTYGSIIYGKAALGFGAIRDAIGGEAFFAALRDYAERERFTIATPDDLLAAFERASGQELDALWQSWFEETNGLATFDEQDYFDLLEEFGLR